MTGRIVVDEPPPERAWWDRFTVEFADGGRMALRDRRRLGRAVLEPDLSTLGPDAAEVGRKAFRERVGRGTSPLKARIMDQRVIAGVGNLLADETLWRAYLSPLRPAGELSEDELDRPAPRAARGHPAGDPPRRRPHRRPHPRARARRRLPPLRRGAGARNGGRPHHLLVSGGAGVGSAAWLILWRSSSKAPGPAGPPATGTACRASSRRSGHG